MKIDKKILILLFYNFNLKLINEKCAQFETETICIESRTHFLCSHEGNISSCILLGWSGKELKCA